MKRGRAGTMTHDYKRNGTTTLFAALNVLTGVVIGQCLPRHRNGEFLKFLRTIDRQVPKGLQIHMILDFCGGAARWIAYFMRAGGVSTAGGTKATSGMRSTVDSHPH